MFCFSSRGIKDVQKIIRRYTSFLIITSKQKLTWQGVHIRENDGVLFIASREYGVYKITQRTTGP